MIIRAITETNDWQFGNGKNSYFSGEAAIEANVKTKILQWVGECYFDNLSGVDWKNLMDYGQQQNLLIAIKSVVLSCYGVVAIQSANFNFIGQTRFDSIQITMQTIYSPSATVTVTAPGAI